MRQFKQAIKRSIMNRQSVPVHKKNIFFSLLFVLFFQSFFQMGKSLLSFKVTPQITTINTITPYDISIVDSNFVSFTGTIIITFPTSKITLTSNSAYTCYQTGNILVTYTCNSNGTSMLQLTNPSNSLLQMTVNNIKNPSNTQDVNFTYQFTYPNGTIITASTSYNYRGYTTGSLQSCTSNFNPSIVHSTSTIQITMTIGNAIDANGSITVQFPSTWSGAPNSSYTPVISSLTQVCTKLSTGVLLNSTLSCFPFSQQVSLSNCFNNSASAGSTVSFSITNILSPSTTSTGNTFTVTTLSSGGSSIDQSSCSVAAVSNTNIPNLETTTDLTVGTNTSFLFDFLAPVPIIAGDSIVISAVSPNNTYFSLYAASNGVISFQASIFTGTYTNSSQIILKLSSSMDIIDTSTQIYVINGVYLQPLISSGTKSITVTLMRSSFSYATQNLALTSSPNYLTSVSIVPQSSTVSQSTSYNFTFTLTNNLGVGASIQIIMPSQLFISVGACSIVVSSLNYQTRINSSYSCSAITNLTIQITNININILPSGTILSLIISNIKNSKTTTTTSPFTIYSYYTGSLTDIVDQNTNITTTMSPATIGTCVVSSSSSIVYADSDYTFNYTVKSSFLANSLIYIKLPSQISVSSTVSLSSKFSLTYINSTQTPLQNCVINSSTINSSQFLIVSGISNVDLVSSTIITLVVSKLVNPDSLQPSDSFGLYQYASDGSLIQKVQSGLTITNTQTNAFSIFFQSSGTNHKNGQLIIYSMQFKSSVTQYNIQLNLAVNDYLILSLSSGTTNNQMYFPTTISSCDIIYTNSGTNVTIINTCLRMSASLLQISLSAALSNSIIYQLSINTIQTPRTYSIPPSLVMTSYKYVSSSISYKRSSSSLIPTANSQPNLISPITLNINTSPSQLFQFQQFTITLTTTNGLMSGDYLLLQIPSLYTYEGSSLISTNNVSDLTTIASSSLCLTSSNLFCSHYQSDSLRILVEELTSNVFSNTTSISITIKNNLYRSPSTFNYAGYYFNAQSYSNLAQIIDSTTDIGSSPTDYTNAAFYLGCGNVSTYHCQTCNLNLTCISCYQPSTINSITYTFDNYIYLTSDFKCVTQCGTGYYIDNVTGICTVCQSPCATCQNSSTKCLSCLQNVTNKFYNSINNTCLNLCPTGFYSDTSNKCQSCSASCFSCQTNSFTCTACSNSTFLSSSTNTCVSQSSCPTNTFADSLSNTCKSCDVSCQGCKSLSTNCTTCTTGYINNTITSNSTYLACTNQCPAGTVNDTVMGCTCATQCLTCINSTSTCLTCNTSSLFIYYYSSTCLTVCPQGTYQTIINGVKTCSVCTQNNCKTCTSNLCTQCSGQYLLSSGVCVVSCGSAQVYTVVNGIKTCQTCYIGCLNCDKGLSQCSTCDTGYLKQGTANSAYCVTSCSSGYINFNATLCLTACPIGYTNTSNICVLLNNTNNNTNNNTKNSTSTSSSTKIVPFPFTISLMVFVILIMLSKLVLNFTIVSAILSGIIGAVQILSWIVLIIILSMGQQSCSSCEIGMYLIVIGIALNYILNIIALIFFYKYIFPDTKFNRLMTINAQKSILSKCPLYTIIIISFATSHKVLQILFSNFLGSRYFSYKLSTVNKLVPLNYLLYISVLPSALAVVGASIISYQFQSQGISSVSYLASIDMIVVTVLGIIISIWVTNRNENDYQIDVNSNNKAEKHYQTQQIFVQGHDKKDGFSDDYNQMFLQQSGLKNTNISAKQAKDSKGYYYKSTRAKRTTRGGQDNGQDPLVKKNLSNARRPTKQKQNQSSFDNHEDVSSEALVIDQQNKRRNIKDQFDSQIDQLKKLEESGDMQVINLQNESKIKSKNQQNKEWFQKVKNMSEAQKQQLKQKIQNSLSEDERQKLKILTSKKIKKEKEKIDQILKLQQEQIKDPKIKQQVKQVKSAVDLLKRKEIKIQEYLLYNQIIKQEEGEDEDQEDDDKNLNSDLNIMTDESNIFDKHVDNSDLQQVIQLSPKKKTNSNLNNMSLSNNKNKQKQSPQNKSNQKRKGSHSKEKTIKKAQKSGTKRKNKRVKGPNDLQINYLKDDELNQHDKKSQQSFDEEDQPSLPNFKPGKSINNNLFKSQHKKGTKQDDQLKNKNRSHQNLHKKGTLTQNDDILLVNVGSGRVKNFQQNQQLQQSHIDRQPPRHLHSTQKLQIKKNYVDKNNAQIDRNIYDSENQIQTLKSFENTNQDFFNQISPSQFNLQNQRFSQNDQVSDVPTHPKIFNNYEDLYNGENRYQPDMTGSQNQQRQHQVTNDQPIRTHINRQKRNMTNYSSEMGINRYNSTNRIDYQSMMQKASNNQKIKQLQQIYLPRLDSKYKNQKKAGSTSRAQTRNKSREQL